MNYLGQRASNLASPVRYETDIKNILIALALATNPKFNIDPLIRWTLLGIALFGVIVSVMAIAVTAAQLVAVIAGVWP